MWKACAPVNKELARLAQETETWIVHHPLSSEQDPQFFIPREISICVWLTTSKILRLDIETSSQIKQFMLLAFSETTVYCLKLTS